MLKPPTDRAVERYKGIPILWDDDDGYHASNGCAVHFGYCDTIEELRAEIDDHFDEDERDTPLDTPSLDTSFHDYEMDV
jgi:hypothetical protein